MNTGPYERPILCGSIDWSPGMGGETAGEDVAMIPGSLRARFRDTKRWVKKLY